MSNEQAAKKFQVGEAVVVVGYGYGAHSDKLRVEQTVVESVGRQWATVKSRPNSRFDAFTGARDAKGFTSTSRLLRPEAWEAEQAEQDAREKLDAIGVRVEERRAPKALTNKAVWEALRGLVEQS